MPRPPVFDATERAAPPSQVATAVPRLGMQRYNFGGEALHGVWASCVVDNVSTATHTATGARLCATQ